MIGLGPSVQGRQQIVPEIAQVELVHQAPAGRREVGDELVVGEADLLAGIEIEIVGCDFDPRPALGTQGGFHRRVGCD